MAEEEDLGPASLLNVLRRDANVRAVHNNITQRVTRVQTAAAVHGVIAPESFDVEQLSLASVAITGINGGASLPEQAVQVEYLRNEQRLLIPAALGMSMLAVRGQMLPNHIGLMTRYWKIASQSYQQLKTLVANNTTTGTLRAAIDAIDHPGTPSPARKTDWNVNTWCTLADGQEDTRTNVILVFAAISLSGQFNCDVRDVGKLLTPELRMADNEWTRLNEYRENNSRLNNKLKPYTLQNIAGLNYTRVANIPLAAWVRAYALSAGILPSADSANLIEYDFTLDAPNAEARTATVTFEQTTDMHIFSVSMNLIAMFGLMHLNKDHTYKGNDTNMDRIGKSYLQTLRTIMTSQQTEMLVTNQEVFVRTVSHPFGLSQCYFVARFMHERNLLANALAIRWDTTPPPVQRVMVCVAALDEWAGVPGGVAMNGVYPEAIDVVRKAAKEYKANPPAYSGLARLYGLQAQLHMSAEVRTATEAILPTVYGFAMSQHVDQASNKDGLALSLGLQNVARSKKHQTDIMKNLWDKYNVDVSNMSLIQFASDAQVIFQRAQVTREDDEVVEGRTQ